MKNYQLYTITLIAVLFLTNCNSDDPVMMDDPLKISQEIKDLIYFKGNESAPVVLINAQSGPDTKLSTGEVDEIFEVFDTTDLLAVNVHQAQTLKSNQITENDITFDRAINLNSESVEILYKVVKYFKDQGRTVYVLGISFGAFVVQELIVQKGVDLADNYLIMVGRLNMNEEMWQAFSEGKSGFFENGVTPVIDQEVEPEVVDRNLNRLAAGFAMNRYTELLNQFENLSKITYVYGEIDQAVGSLANVELEFLESKKVNIITGSGDHDQTIENFIVPGFDQAFGIQLQ